MVTRKEITDAIEEVTKKLTDEGKVVEAGFAAYLVVVWGPEAVDKMPRDQLGALREAYFSGAQHLWATINNVMDEDAEPTADDLKRMDLIHSELNRWAKSMAERVMPTQGSA